MKTLVIYCHPVPSSFNHAIFEVAVTALQQSQQEVRTIDLYEEGFDPVLKREEREAYTDNTQLVLERVKTHIEALKWAEHLVFIFPTWFYGPPAMLKGWLERVWLPGISFQPAKGKGKTPASCMRSVHRLTVITTGGSPWWLTAIMGDPCKRLFTRCLRSLFALTCKVVWMRLNDMNHVTLDAREQFLQKVTQTLSKG